MSIAGVRLDAGKSKNDYPRGYELQVSDDGKTWGKPLVEGKGSSAMTEILLPQPTKTKFIRITQTGRNGGFWSIHELEVLTDRAGPPRRRHKGRADFSFPTTPAEPRSPCLPNPSGD